MAEKGLKTTLKINTTIVGKLTSINSIEVTTDSIETTTLDDDYRTFRPGLKDAGEVAIEGFFLKGDVGQVAMKEAQDTNTVDSYTITFASGITWEFDGFITSFKPIGDANLDDNLGFSATIKISGAPTWTEPAA